MRYNPFAMGKQTVALTTETFAGKIGAGIVFVDFWAEWCGPCKAFAPIYEKVAAGHADIVFAKVDTEAEEALGQQFEVESIPTLIAFRDGEPVFRQAGAVSAAALEAIVAKVKAIDMVQLTKVKALTEKSLRGERPPGVPAEAVWDPADKEWALGVKDKQGQNHGVWRFWRADGTLCNQCPFVHGKPHGPFQRFHENGEVSQDGVFDNGLMHGTRRWVATSGYTTEQMHENGTSEKVRRTEIDYDRDRVTAIRHFNAAGVRCMPMSGEPYPARPEGVSVAAEFVEQAKQWREVNVDEERKRHGLCRFWADDGTFLWQGTYEHGELNGPFEEANLGNEFAHEEVARVRGQQEHGLAVGIWSGHSADGAELFSRDLGVYERDEALADSPVFDDVTKSAEAWWLLSKELLSEKKYGQALLAIARAGATSQAVKQLAAIYETLPLPRSADSALSVAQSDVEESGEEFNVLVNSLLRGGDSGLVLRQFAIVMDQRDNPRAAIDFINAAILLHPAEIKALYFTRALILLSLGLVDHAKIDAAALKAMESPSGDYLTQYINALLPKYDFWPANEMPKSSYDNLPQTPAQPTAAIHAVIRKYATRIMQCRQVLESRFKPGMAPSWLVPDVSKLLPDGPVELETRTLEAPAEDEDEIEIDETLDAGSLGIPSLLITIRSEWNALTWLLWVAGMNDIVLPKRPVVAPKLFSQAAGMAAQRLWRARDRRAAGRTFEDHQIEGFSFNGIDIDALDENIVGIAEQQYADMQALFYWLADKKNQSPWQDNLRGS